MKKLERKINKREYKKERDRLKEKGITLIALVITIIVLLILAGVTIATITGEDGILKKAINAKEKADQANAEEQVQIAVMGSYNDRGNLDYESLKENLNKISGISGVPLSITDDSFIGEPPRFIVKVEMSSGDIYKVEVYKDGDVKVGEKSDKTIVDVEDMIGNRLKDFQGKFVDLKLDLNGKNGTLDDWRIFYAENGRVFLIATDYVSTEKLKELNVVGKETILGKIENHGLQEYNTKAYGIWWGPNDSNPVQHMNLSTDVIKLVKHTQYDLLKNKTIFNNSAAVSQLLNTDAWSGIKNASGEINKIDFVIGSPTLEMWCKAWNVNMPATIGAATQDDLINVYSDGSKEYGYGVLYNLKFIDWAYMDGTKEKLNNLDELGKIYPVFFPHTTDKGNTDGYLLASPSYMDSNKLINVDYDGSLGWSDFWDPTYGVRPLVCLNEEIKLRKSNNSSIDGVVVYDII